MIIWCVENRINPNNELNDNQEQSLAVTGWLHFDKMKDVGYFGCCGEDYGLDGNMLEVNVNDIIDYLYTERPMAVPTYAPINMETEEDMINWCITNNVSPNGRVDKHQFNKVTGWTHWPVSIYTYEFNRYTSGGRFIKVSHDDIVAYLHTMNPGQSINWQWEQLQEI